MDSKKDSEFLQQLSSLPVFDNYINKNPNNNGNGNIHNYSSFELMSSINAIQNVAACHHQFIQKTYQNTSIKQSIFNRLLSF